MAAIAALALCTLGACIGPGLEPPNRQASGRPRGPGSLDEASDASTPTGTGNFGNAGNSSGGDGTTNPDNPAQPTPTDPGPGPADPGGQGPPRGEEDEDAGTDPADSP
jgi:hypothetical protein